MVNKAQSSRKGVKHLMVNDERFLDRFSFREQYLATRSAKAAKIIAVLREEGVQCEHSLLLDIGCSQGQITYQMA